MPTCTSHTIPMWHVRLRAVGAGMAVTSGTHTVTWLKDTEVKAHVATRRNRYTPGR